MQNKWTWYLKRIHRSSAAISLSLKTNQMTYSEGVIQIFKDILFIFNVVYMLTLDYIYFFHCFNCKFCARLFLKPSIFDISKSTYLTKILNVSVYFNRNTSFINKNLMKIYHNQKLFLQFIIQNYTYLLPKFEPI